MWVSTVLGAIVLVSIITNEAISACRFFKGECSYMPVYANVLGVKARSVELTKFKVMQFPRKKLCMLLMFVLFCSGHLLSLRQLSLSIHQRQRHQSTESRGWDPRNCKTKIWWWHWIKHAGDLTQFHNLNFFLECKIPWHDLYSHFS